MFTGIVQSIGKVHENKNTVSGSILVIDAGFFAKKITTGSSVSVHGVCLTVVKKKSGLLWFNVMDETRAKTTAHNWKVGSRLNLESAIRVGDELGGHWVYGHVDGVGKVVQKKTGASLVLTIRPPKDLLQYIVPQGAVTIDGVSLTVCKKTSTVFSVSLVSYTQTHTTLGELEKDDDLNIETDMFFKYIDVWLKQSRSQK